MIYRAIVILLMAGLFLGLAATQAHVLPWWLWTILVGVFAFWWGVYDEGRNFRRHD